VWYWLSFCDSSRPKGTQSLGICIVEGQDEKDAHRNATLLGLNPGGEILIQPMPGVEIKDAYTYRLILPKEAKKVSALPLRDMAIVTDPSVFGDKPPQTSLVHEECNERHS
jgi:hypothetical protein